MLVSLHVENIAVIKSLTLEPHDSFTVLTGETGAGKSILIDSIMLLCGARSERELIRNGEDYALVEGVFTVGEKTAKQLEEMDIYPDEDGLIFISRKITADGRGTSKIGDRTVPASKLKEISSYLVNIHGQQDTYAFRTGKSCEEFLDTFCGNDELLDECKKAYENYKALNKELNTLKKDEQDKNDRADFIRYRLEELKKIKPKIGEEEELKEKRLYVANIDNINRAYDEVNEKLYDGSASTNGISAIAQIIDSIRALEKIKNTVPNVDELIERLQSARYELEDISESARQMINNDVDNSESELDRIEERLMKLGDLKRKYGSVESAIKEKEKMTNELERLENYDYEINELEKKIKTAKIELENISDRLTEMRKKGALVLEKRVMTELKDLDMEKTVLKVELEKKEFTETGTDEVRFLVATNVGEEAKPLGKIASGGELSRIMLALKTVSGDDENQPTMIFDEIDTGISGKTSQKIGIKLKGLTKNNGSQVVCITHAAQIASLAHTHVKISKSEIDGRTQTKMNKLNEDERIEELARLMGGINIGEAIMNAAKTLREEGKNI